MAKEKTGYEDVGVDEIRRLLRDEYNIDDKELLAQTKVPLVAKLLELQGVEDAEINQDIDTVFDEVEETPDNTMQPYTEEEAENTMPAYASEAWHEYVMLQFREDELVDSAPTCDGCRRVIEQVVGSIISSTLPNIFPPNTSNHGTSTISVRLEILVTNESHPLCGQIMTCEEVADVNKDNCDHPYYKYASATAASRAEGRALRKLLRLRNIHTAEEISERAETEDNDMEWEVDEPITDSQINAIELICQRTDMDVMDFVNSGKRSDFDDIHMVSKGTGQRMIQELNKIQRSVKEKPKAVRPYSAGWRNHE